MKSKWISAAAGIMLSALVAFPVSAQEVWSVQDGTVAEAVAEETGDLLGARYQWNTEAINGSGNRSGRLDTRALTKTEIANLYQNAKNASNDMSYDVQPSVTAPYAAGKASAANRNATVQRINMYRQIAGITTVTESESLSDDAQHGAVLLAATGVFAHYQSKPADMDQDFYDIAVEATSSSNLSAGYSRMEYGVDGCMRDNSGSNLTSLGHRRWFLNPSMLYVGVGEAKAANGYYGNYYAYKVFDKSNENIDYNFISWPSSGYFPAELIEQKIPWSISLNPERYMEPSLNDIQVEVTNPAGHTEVFSSSDNSSDTSGSGKYFNVNNGGYGEGSCIIFNFADSNYNDYKVNGTYKVKVSGLKSKATREAVSIEYTTEVFSASENAGKTEVTDAQYNEVEKFVERLYTKCLGRASDADGKKDWTEKLVNHEITGAQTGQGFVFSQEYLNKNTSNEEYLNMLYETYLGRESDADGMADWINMLENGVSRLYVFKGFAESQEYGNICEQYGIDRGEVSVSDGRDLNAGATMFVYRLYDKALSRQAEEAGLNDWSGAIARGEKSAESVAQSFFHSDEFQNKGYDDTDYIKVLYRTFLGREYDDEGLQYWLNELSQGQSRDEVMQGFSGSQEFHNIMASYGL